nr:hypothetical protein [Candidatus Sigynarchaeota archaeon]
MVNAGDSDKAPREIPLAQKEQRLRSSEIPPVQEDPKAASAEASLVSAGHEVTQLDILALQAEQKVPLPEASPVQNKLMSSPSEILPEQPEQKASLPGERPIQKEQERTSSEVPPIHADMKVTLLDAAPFQKEKKVFSQKKMRCAACANNLDARVNAVILQEQKESETLLITFTIHCGYPCQVIINRNFDLIEQSCTSFVPREITIDTFDFDKFLEGNQELDDVLLKKQVKQAAKMASLEDQMKIAVKKLVKPLGLLIPTTAQKKTQAQLSVERDERLKEFAGIDVNIVYVRVLEFEKLAASGNSWTIDKLCKALKGIDKASIIGFIKKIDNDFLVTYDVDTHIVKFYNPSKPELEILSREFEKWLRFNRL